MTKRFTSSVLILFPYAILMYLIALLLTFLRPFLPKWKEQLARPLWSVPRLELQQPTCVIYCSSAGEYEQAKPVLDRLSKRGFFPVLIFFSASGYYFAKRRDEKLPCILAPLDHPLAWNSFFKELRPKFTLIVRHEFWPGFVTTAAAHSSLYVINYSIHDASRSPSYLTKLLLAPVRRIFVITPKDHAYLAEQLKLTQVCTSADTKFDRVLERAQQQAKQAAGLKAELQELAKGRHIVVLGSAWKEDLALIMSGWRLLDSTQQDQYFFVVVPHDISHENLDILNAVCGSFKVSPLLYSRKASTSNTQTPVLIVDMMGKLAEVYSSASSCFVGGALHHRVHNVLEPAAYNLDIAFGPRYETQREAQILVQEGLVTVCQTAQEAASWLKQTKQTAKDPGTLDFVKKHAGASDNIVQQILVDIKR